MLLRRKNVEEHDPIGEEYTSDLELDISQLTESPETETELQKKQLEKMAEEKPEDFAKLLRSWIADD